MASQNSFNNSKTFISILIFSVLFVDCLIGTPAKVNNCTGRCASCLKAGNDESSHNCMMCYRSKLVFVTGLGEGGMVSIGKCEGTETTINNCEGVMLSSEQLKCVICLPGYKLNDDLTECNPISLENCGTINNDSEREVKECTSCIGKFAPNSEGTLCEAYNDAPKHCLANKRTEAGIQCSDCGWDKYLDNENKCVPKPETSKPCESDEFTGYNSETKRCGLCWFQGGYFATDSELSPTLRILTNQRRITQAGFISEISSEQICTKDPNFDPNKSTLKLITPLKLVILFSILLIMGVEF